MNRTERLYQIKRLLDTQRVVPKAQFLRELDVSPATFKRDLEYLRERLHAPIEYDVSAGGYRYGDASCGPRHALPGLWFNAHEIHALLTMQQLLQELQPGLLTPHVQPLLQRLQQLLDSRDAPHSEVQKRIRIHRINARHITPATFGPISTAVLRRRQLQITHFHRARNTTETRTLSPQRLTYYRDNWYLDAWCHLRQGIRSFSLDVMQEVTLLDVPALEIADTALDAALTASYGIFGGQKLEWAVLRFSPEKARWVSHERWHAQQQAEFDADGHYILRVPYSDDRELVMDILRHMPDITVLGPESLQTRVRQVLEKSLAAMGK